MNLKEEKSPQIEEPKIEEPIKTETHDNKEESLESLKSEVISNQQENIKQEELEKLIANPMSMKDPRVQQLRSELDKLRQQLGGSSQAGTDQRPITVIR